MKKALTLPLFYVMLASASFAQSGITESVNRFLATLSADERAKTQYAFTDSLRYKWTNLPVGLVPRPGIAYGSLSDQSPNYPITQLPNYPITQLPNPPLTHSPNFTMTTPDENFDALHLELPPPPTPKGVYKPCLIVGNFIYVSGHGPCLPDGSLMTGRIGADADAAFGIEAAQQTGLAIVSTLKASLGSLNRVKQVVKILGMVNCVAEFDEHPKIINGCSELFAKIWGEERGIGVRSAVGMGSLPSHISVEIEAMFELEAA